MRYSIVSGNSQGDFLIDSSTGQITVAKPLDREATAAYSLTVSTQGWGTEHEGSLHRAMWMQQKD